MRRRPGPIAICQFAEALPCEGSSFYEILFLVIFWVLAAIFDVYYEASILGFEARIPGEPYNFGRTLFIVLLVSFVSATLVACLEVLYLSEKLRRRPLGITLLLKTTFYLSCIFITTSAAAWINISFDFERSFFHQEVLEHFIDYMASAEMISTFVYWGLMVLLALFILEVSEKFGQGVLLSFMLGKYYRPREELRIFMFMDLKSSTAFAEKLGHLKYSRLIQDCFYDLTDVVTKYKAVIYQYVGDEIVLTWLLNQGIEQGNCLKTFYAYDEAIQRRANYYNAEYGVIPVFKAGLNAGIVTAAEVGEIKKELAYHGDAINTAARIQDQCNAFGSRLLVSEELRNYLLDHHEYDFKLIGDVALKGKELSVSIYDVRRLNQSAPDPRPLPSRSTA